MTLDIEYDCYGCDGEGSVVFQEVRITDKAIPFHMANHAYSRPPGSSLAVPFIGADCDCPRRKKNVRKKCIGCNGTGKIHRKIAVPQPGDKAHIKDIGVLEEVFGEEIPLKPGTVIRTEANDQLELRTGYAVQISWDKAPLKDDKPKDGIEMWAFDLLEVSIV